MLTLILLWWVRYYVEISQYILAFFIELAALAFYMSWTFNNLWAYYGFSPIKMYLSWSITDFGWTFAGQLLALICLIEQKRLVCFIHQILLGSGTMLQWCYSRVLMRLAMRFKNFLIFTSFIKIDRLLMDVGYIEMNLRWLKLRNESVSVVHNYFMLRCMGSRWAELHMNWRLMAVTLVCVVMMTHIPSTQWMKKRIKLKFCRTLTID